MQKIIILIFCSLFALQLSAADYRVLLLGDIHYDHLKYHTSAEGKIISRYSKVHVTMWQKKQPSALFTAAARQLDKDVPFVLQLGDFIEGCGATPDLRAQMMRDGFNAVKSHFPNHKLLAVKGNHDIRCDVDITVNGKVKKSNGKDNETYKKNFLPLLAKELGHQEIKSNYSVLHNNDLYIFYDNFIYRKSSFNFLQKTLAAYPDVRKIFFITHTPVLPCSTYQPGALLANHAEIAKLLASRNAIILAAHTHQISLVKVKIGSNTLTQFVSSSIGRFWNCGKKFEPLAKNKDEFYSKFTGRFVNAPKTLDAKKYLDSLNIEEFTLYNAQVQGFCVMKVSDSGSVEIEFYNNDSNQPALVKKLH